MTDSSIASLDGTRYDVAIIGRWDPSPFGFGTHRKGVQVQAVKDGWPEP